MGVVPLETVQTTVCTSRRFSDPIQVPMDRAKEEHSTPTVTRSPVRTRHRSECRRNGDLPRTARSDRFQHARNTITRVRRPLLVPSPTLVRHFDQELLQQAAHPPFPLGLPLPRYLRDSIDLITT